MNFFEALQVVWQQGLIGIVGGVAMGLLALTHFQLSVDRTSKRKLLWGMLFWFSLVSSIGCIVLFGFSVSCLYSFTPHCVKFFL